jgi:hypothetical protein
VPAHAHDEPLWDVATPGPELGLGIAVHALVSAVVVTLGTQWAVSSSLSSTKPLGGFSGLSTGSVAALTTVDTLVLPLSSGVTIYLLQRHNRLWRVQPGLIFLAGMAPELLAQLYYAVSLRDYTLQGGLGDPGLLPRLVGAQVAAALLVPVTQALVTHLLREPDPDR